VSARRRRDVNEKQLAVAKCEHLAGWLQVDGWDPARGSLGRVMVRCSGCQGVFNGEAGLGLLATRQQRELSRLHAKVEALESHLKEAIGARELGPQLDPRLRPLMETLRMFHVRLASAEEAKRGMGHAEVSMMASFVAAEIEKVEETKGRPPIDR